MSALDALRRGADNAPQTGAETQLLTTSQLELSWECGELRIATIAVRLGKSDEVTRKELSGAASHKLGAVDALAIARIACEAGTPHCYDYAA